MYLRIGLVVVKARREIGRRRCLHTHLQVEDERAACTEPENSKAIDNGRADDSSILASRLPNLQRFVKAGASSGYYIAFPVSTALEPPGQPPAFIIP